MPKCSKVRSHCRKLRSGNLYRDEQRRCVIDNANGFVMRSYYRPKSVCNSAQMKAAAILKGERVRKSISRQKSAQTKIAALVKGEQARKSISKQKSAQTKIAALVRGRQSRKNNSLPRRSKRVKKIIPPGGMTYHGVHHTRDRDRF